MADRDFSVYFVKVDSEVTGRHRRVRSPAGLKTGSIVEVFFALSSASDDGQWHRCEVVEQPKDVTGSGGVYVKLAPAQVTAQLTCRCDGGYVCEEHPDEWPGHDGCDFPPRDCMDPRCPWWQGPQPPDYYGPWTEIRISRTRKPGPQGTN